MSDSPIETTLDRITTALGLIEEAPSLPMADMAAAYARGYVDGLHFEGTINAKEAEGHLIDISTRRRNQLIKLGVELTD